MFAIKIAPRASSNKQRTIAGRSLRITKSRQVVTVRLPRNTRAQRVRLVTIDGASGRRVR